jgi:DNA-binding NtrC family response regulator
MRAARAAVLIIAEDGVARQVYGELFAMRGWAVVTASGAREGLRLARDRRISVVVLSLPTGTARLREKLRSMRPQLRVHTTGMMPLPFDVMAPAARQQLL